MKRNTVHIHKTLLKQCGKRVDLIWICGEYGRSNFYD